MLGPESHPLRDFADRAIRRLLEDPLNLRDLLLSVVPDLAGRLDFSRVQKLDREFPLEDWRRREADLLFRIPFEQGEHPDALVCILLEHQSRPDPAMPLRMLLYAVLYWEREWMEWTRGHPAGEPLRLSAVVPVVFHTGSEPWKANRVLRDLIHGPDEACVYAPDWAPLFWELHEWTPERLLRAEGAWLRTLAVVRAEDQETEVFCRTIEDAIRRLRGLPATEEIRRKELLRFILSWALLRRPQAEEGVLTRAVIRAAGRRSDRSEVERMRKFQGPTYQEELLAEAEVLAQERAEVLAQERAEVLARERSESAVAQALRGTLRDTLRVLLEERFGPVGEEILQRIAACEDPDRLRNAIRQCVRIQSLDELTL